MRKSKYNSSGSGPKPRLGVPSTASGLARPGVRAAKSAAAESVMAANGKLARPGFYQKKPQSAAGSGSIARPGYAQGISGKGVNAKPMKRGTTTD